MQIDTEGETQKAAVPEPEAKKGNTMQIEALDKELQIVRAITQPEGRPIVGLKVSEADLPKLRYVLSCQQAAAKEASSDVAKKSLRDTTMEAAEVLARRLKETPERKLPYTSWFDVHKVLAAEGIVTYSATGMRGVQMAVDRLAKAKVMSIEADGMVARIDCEEKDELEQLVFPEEFMREELEPTKRSKRRGDGILDDWEEALFDEEDLDDDELDELIAGYEGADVDEAAEDGIPAEPPKKRHKFGRTSGVTANQAADKKDKKRKKKDKKESKEERRERKKQRRLEKLSANEEAECAKDDDPATFEDLFGLGDGPASHCSASDGNPSEPGPSSRLRPPATPSKAPIAPSLERQLRDAIDQMLEGLDLATLKIREAREQLEANLSLDPGALNEHSEFVKTLLSEKIQKMQGEEPTKEGEACRTSGTDPAPMESAVANSPAAAVKKPPAKQESETGMIWTYEVIGKNIGIRVGPSINSDHQGDYIENGELFNVVERVRVEGEKRIYLKLADARGWAYDRSAKDESKVVVDEQ